MENSLLTGSLLPALASTRNADRPRELSPFPTPRRPWPRGVAREVRAERERSQRDFLGESRLRAPFKGTVASQPLQT